VTSSLLAVLAQRLLRRTCQSCGGTGAPAPGSADSVRCEVCYGVGYKGRLAVYEIMTMNDEMRRLTASRADAVTLYETARKNGFSPMREDALLKVKMGLTDENEVYRILH